jgi:lipoate-protein ligase A
MLALDAALPAAHPLAGHDVVQAYRWLGAAFAATLRKIAPAITDASAGATYRTAGPGCIILVGVAEARADQQARRAAPEGSPGALRSLACFGSLSPYEVALAHAAGPTVRKLVGLSQVRKRGMVLYQAGMYTRHSGAHLASLLALPAGSKERLAAELDRRVATLEQIGLRPEDLPELMATFDREAAARLSSATTDDCR